MWQENVRREIYRDRESVRVIEESDYGRLVHRNKVKAKEQGIETQIRK